MEGEGGGGRRRGEKNGERGKEEEEEREEITHKSGTIHCHYCVHHTIGKRMSITYDESL